MHVIIVQTSLIFASLFGASPCSANEVCQRARCHACGVKGNNTYQIVYTGNSGIGWMGLGLGRNSSRRNLKIGSVINPMRILICMTALNIYVENSIAKPL